MSNPRPEDVPYPIEEHANRVMCGDPIACAYAWIEGYAKNLSAHVSSYYDDDYNYGDAVTTEELIDTGMSHVDTEEEWGGEYISRGEIFEGEVVEPLFWDKLAILKQIEIPDNKRSSFFSCAC